MKNTMKLFGGVNLRSLAVATLVSSSMLFVACEKETASALNPENSIKKNKAVASYSLQDELLIKKASQLEKLLGSKNQNKSLLPLNIDYVVCEAILNKKLCNNLKAYEVGSTSARFENVFGKEGLSLQTLSDFMNEVQEWVENENLKTDNFRGNFLIDLDIIEDEVVVRLLQMAGEEIIVRTGGRPDDSYNADDYFTVTSAGSGGGRSNANCEFLGGDQGAPDVLESRINRAISRVFYEGYYVNVMGEYFNYYLAPAHCSNDPDLYRSKLHTTENDHDNCKMVLSPSQMKHFTNGYYDYELLELRCQYQGQDFLNIDCVDDRYGSDNMIAAIYTFGTFIANPIVEELTSFP